MENLALGWLFEPQHKLSPNPNAWQIHGKHQNFRSRQWNKPLQLALQQTLGLK
jgi:hypothetical protein